MAVQDLLTGQTVDVTGTAVPLAGQSTVEVESSTVWDEAKVYIEGALTGGEFSVIAILGTANAPTFTTSYQGANQLRARLEGARANTNVSIKVGEP